MLNVICALVMLLTKSTCLLIYSLINSRSRFYQADPADDGDSVLRGVELEDLNEREADGDRQRSGRVDHWTAVDAVLSIVLDQHRYQPLLRRRVHRPVNNPGTPTLTQPIKTSFTPDAVRCGVVRRRTSPDALPYALHSISAPGGPVRHRAATQWPHARCRLRCG